MGYRNIAQRLSGCGPDTRSGGRGVFSRAANRAFYRMAIGDGASIHASWSPKPCNRCIHPNRTEFMAGGVLCGRCRHDQRYRCSRIGGLVKHWQMKTRLAPIKIVFALYAGGGLIGLSVGTAGLVLKNRGLERAGMAILVCAFAIGCIPLLGACCYLLWKKVRSK